MKRETERYFKLKDTKADQETSIRLYVFHRNFPHRRFVYGIKKSILPELWDAETQRPTKNKKLIKEYEKHIPTIANDLMNITRVINDVSSKVDNYFTMASVLDNNITISSDNLKDYLDTNFNKKIEPIAKVKKETLSKYIERFIKEAETGFRLANKKKGKSYDLGSIKNFKTFQSQFLEYQTKYKIKLDFEDITMDFYNDFVKYLNDKNYRPNSIGKHIARIKVFMRASYDEKLHQNLVFTSKDFHVFKVPTEQVYLTADELKAIHNIDLTHKPHLMLYRDVFLIGCYTAQRVSDYNRIKSTYIQKLGKVNVIVLNQDKGNEKVIIPIKKELDEILKRYDYNPPRVTEQKLNNAIKQVCKLANITQTIEITEVIGGKETVTTKAKYEKVASHTARRTGATLMHKAEIQTIDAMKITGHKKESTYLSYIKMTKEETATKLANNPYFKN
jgi:integrase